MINASSAVQIHMQPVMATPRRDLVLEPWGTFTAAGQSQDPKDPKIPKVPSVPFVSARIAR
jgi:hypothetical protein